MLSCARICSVLVALAAVGAYFVFVPTVNFRPSDIPDLSTIRPDGSQTVVVVTGANSGLGYESSLELAAHGAHVVMACRSGNKCAAAKASIDADPRVSASGGITDCMSLDLGTLSSVVSFATAFRERGLPVHVLMLNAGLLLNTKSMSADGIEAVFAISHVGHHLLTSLLEDIVVASSPSRIVSVSSKAYERASRWSGGIEYDGLLGPEKTSSYSLMGNYGRAKLANVLHAQKLARRLEGTGVLVNTLHPGMVSTEVVRNVQASISKQPTWFEEHILSPGLEMLYETIGFDAKTGAMTQVYLAVSPEVEEKNLSMRSFYYPVAVTTPFKETITDAAADELWDWTEKVLTDRGFATTE